MISYNSHLPLPFARRADGVRGTVGVLAARMRNRRRRARRYCLWGHHGQYVQVGSQTDRYLQRRLTREAEILRSLRRTGQAIATAMFTVRVSSLEATEALRQLSDACKALDVRTKPLILP